MIHFSISPTCTLEPTGPTPYTSIQFKESEERKKRVSHEIISAHWPVGVTGEGVRMVVVCSVLLVVTVVGTHGVYSAQWSRSTEGHAFIYRDEIWVWHFHYNMIPFNVYLHALVLGFNQVSWAALISLVAETPLQNFTRTRNWPIGFMLSSMPMQEVGERPNETTITTLVYIGNQFSLAYHAFCHQYHDCAMEGRGGGGMKIWGWYLSYLLELWLVDWE